MRNLVLSGCLLGLPPDSDEESDQLATSFITPFGSYCYVSMPFGLKNAGATYQRCMQACFSDQINPPIDPDRLDPPRATVAVYVDDIVVKTSRADDLVATLSTTFANLKRFNIKLNPEKCTFGVPKGKLLGYMVSDHGIEAIRDKIAAITNMGPIRGVKGVQRLTGCLAALSQFIARLGERGMPLYKLLKKSDTFVWTEEAQAALDRLKALLSSPPVLVAPPLFAVPPVPPAAREPALAPVGIDVEPAAPASELTSPDGPFDPHAQTDPRANRMIHRIGSPFRNDLATAASLAMSQSSLYVRTSAANVCVEDFSCTT